MKTTKRIANEVEVVRSYLDKSDRVALEVKLGAMNPWDSAQIMAQLELEEQGRLMSLLRPARAADVMEELPDEQAAKIVSELPLPQAADVVEKMDSDEGADLLQSLPEKARKSILKEMEREEREDAEELLSHSPKSAGGIMMKEFIEIRDDQKVGEVLQDLQSKAERYADYPVSYLYVLDREKRLQGVLPFRDLMFRANDTPVHEIMVREPASVPVDMDQEEVALFFERYHYLAVPVVDRGARMVGIVTQDDALKIVEQEASEDLLKFSGIVGGEETHDMPFFRRAGNRLAWLSINILLNLLAACVIWFHEDTLQAVIGVAMFLPIISDMSGCSGNQAIAVAIRELATGKIAPGDFLRVWWSEASIGLFNGLALGAQLGFVAWVWKGSLPLAGVVGAALWMNTVVSMTIGSLVPLILKRLGRDPALASVPILTTLTDLLGFFLVLSLTARFLA